MKLKYILFIFVLFACFGSVRAQYVIQNGGFELWSDSVPSFPFYWDSYDHLFAEVGGPGVTQQGWCTKDTTPANVFAGNASCKLKTAYSPNADGIYPGTVMYGRFISSGGMVGDSFSGPMPTIFAGNWKYEPNGSDTARYQVFFSRWDTLEGRDSVLIGPAGGLFANTNGFVPFSFKVSNPNNFVADTILIIFNSSYSSSGNFDTSQIGSTLWVDNLSFVYCQPLDSTIVASICQGQSYNFNGMNLGLAGTYKDTVTNSQGCDSVVTLKLSVMPIDTVPMNETICQDSSYFFNGQTLTSAGAYYETYTSFLTGCDSVVELLLTVEAPDTGVINKNICSGSSYTFNGQNLNESGTYYEALSSLEGCDSVVTLNLQVVSQFTSQITDTICRGSSYSFNGQKIDSTGTYVATISAQGGCDSVITLSLTVDTLPPISYMASPDSFCSNQTVVFLTGGSPAGGNYSGNGVTDSLFNPSVAGLGSTVVTYTYTDASGCHDSAVTTIVVEVCTGIEGQSLKSSIILYPNPAENILTLRSDWLENGGIVVVYDITGKQVDLPVISRHSSEIVFNTSHLSPGMYWIKLIVDGLSTGEKFIKLE